MPGMLRSKKAEKLFREIMGEPQNASKKISVRPKKQIENTAPINVAYDQSQGTSYER